MQGSVWEVLVVFTRLGLTSFGGPVAHLGYFRDELVERRRWLDEESYADLVALCQFLPGPASSQVGIALGIRRAGLVGGLAAWLGFTLPSAVAMIFFAYSLLSWGNLLGDGVLHGLKIVAVAVVAVAVWGMAGTLTPDRPRQLLAVAVAGAALVCSQAWGQLLLISGAGLGYWAWERRQGNIGLAAVVADSSQTEDQPLPWTVVPRGLAVACVILFFVGLVGLPLLRQATSNPVVAMFDTFYRVGALVFGGGHVVLPLLQVEVVPPGWVTNEQFVAGYGAAQAVPGPLFTFTAYLGTLAPGPPGGIAGAALALIAVYVPSFLLVIGALPFWLALRRNAAFGSALRGVNAAVVGLLGAALYNPVWTSAIHAPPDLALALVAFAMLKLMGLPPWSVVLITALAAQVFYGG